MDDLHNRRFLHHVGFPKPVGSRVRNAMMKMGWCLVRIGSKWHS